MLPKKRVERHLIFIDSKYNGSSLPGRLSTNPPPPTHTHTHANTHAHTRAHTHTCTHTHTHTPAPRSITQDMVVLSGSADPLNVNIMITYVSRT